MKKFVFIILALIVSVYLFSYAKEEQHTTTAPKVPTKTEDVENALMIVGYYRGSIDGKMGPLTKKAIRDFQRDNNLQVDGKVGPKTWDKLSQYLNDLMAKQGCLSIYNEIYQIMDDKYYKDVSREEFEKFIDGVKSVFQNRILQQNELDYFRYHKATELITRLKNPQDNYTYFYVGEMSEEIEKIALAYEESLGIKEGQLIDKGFKVTEVEPRSDSFEKGLRENDIIIKINDEFVRNLTNDQIDKKLLKAEPYAKVNLRIISHQDNQEKLLEDVTCKKFDKKHLF